MNPPDVNLYLVGFMGTGKTTVGRAVAHKIGFHLLDSDHEIERLQKKTIADICTMIRNAGLAGIPMVKYNLTFIGVVRTARTVGRGGSSLSAFDYDKSVQEPALTEAGAISDEGAKRFEAFLKARNDPDRMLDP